MIHSSFNIKDVIMTLKRDNVNYDNEVVELRKEIDFDLEFLMIATNENDEVNIVKCKNRLNKARKRLMELEYFSLVNW